MFAKFTKQVFSTKLLNILTIIVMLFSIWVSFTARSVKAQTATPGTAPIIVLDNATPSVDIVISPDNGASGVVYVEMVGVHLIFRDSSNADVLGSTDKRLSVLAIQLAEAASAHTLHLERLPGIDQAQVRVTSQNALPIINTVPISKDSSTDSQSDAQPVSSIDVSKTHLTLAPAQTLPVTLTDKGNMLSLELSNQDSTIQVTDKSGAVLFTATSTKEISGMSMRLEPGNYDLNIANKDLTSTSESTVTISPAPAIDLSGEGSNTTTVSATMGSACSATVNVAAMNLRSGPGTAYTVLGTVGQQTKLAVGGVNREGGWLLVKSAQGTAWIAQGSAALSGTCNSLPTFDIPVRNTVTVISQPPSSGNQSNTSHENENEHENENHEDGEDED